MIGARLYPQAANAALFGSVPTTSEDTRSMNDLAQISGRPVPLGPRPRLYYGRVMLDPTRVGHDAGLVSGELIYPLTQLVGSMVTVALDIAAEVPGGVPINVLLYPLEGDPYSAPAYWTLSLQTGGSLMAPSEDWP